MIATPKEHAVAAAFERDLLTVPFDRIAPLQLVIARDPHDPEQYTLLDGHLRLAVLQDLKKTEARCLVSTDDEAFTYNKRIKRLATIQEHKMILRALSLGVPEARLARALDVNIKTIKKKRRLLDGICDEAAELLKDKQVALSGFQILKKMKPMRQIEAAQLMVAMNKFTINYARSVLAATPETLLVSAATPKQIKGISREQLDLMECWSANLEREVRLVEDSYGADHLDLVLARGYISKLMTSDQITRYRSLHHPDYVPAFEKITETEAFAS